MVESYTSWRGLEFEERETFLTTGKECWGRYKLQDEKFLKKTGIKSVLEKHQVLYVNVTDEVWSNRCVSRDKMLEVLGKKAEVLKYKDLLDYTPQQLFEIRDKATFISLAKIKLETDIPYIYVSMSVKNLFGLIPHPSRWQPFHENNHRFVPEAIRDIYFIYTSLFKKNLWVLEGIKTLVLDYCGPNQKVEKNKGLLFVGKDGKRVDSSACEAMGIDPKRVPYLQMI